MVLDRNYVNVRQLDWVEQHKGDKFECRRKKLADATGGDDLGASLYEVPPGKTAWPRHYHLVNEEALFLLAGEGTLRLGRNSVTVEAGDYVSLPAGKRHAHQLINDGDETLRYLCMSTMEDPEVIMYPDSEKVGIMAGAPPGGDGDERVYEAYHKQGESLDYWEGELEETDSE